VLPLFRCRALAALPIAHLPQLRRAQYPPVQASCRIDDIHETGELPIHRVKDGAKIWHKVSALFEVLPRLAPDGVHDEVAGDGLLQVRLKCLCTAVRGGTRR
jgi:hypothetical protein